MDEVCQRRGWQAAKEQASERDLSKKATRAKQRRPIEMPLNPTLGPEISCQLERFTKVKA